MRYLFSLPLRGRQRKMLMPFPPAWKPTGLEAGQGLTEGKNSRGALGLSLFCPLPARASQWQAGLSRKGKNVFLCDLCASSEAGGDKDRALFT